MIGDEWYWDEIAQGWRIVRSVPATFLRFPARIDLKPVKAPRPLPEPSYYRRELDAVRPITYAELIGLIAMASSVSFILGYFLGCSL